MIVCGIDPGITGAVAVIDGAALVASLPMPVLTTGKSRRVNAAELARFLAEYQPALVALERVGARPGQGVSSMFSFGHAAGLVEGVVAALALPLMLLTPQAWKRSHGLVGKNKDEARAVAQRLYPGAALGRKKDLALAEAMLIARAALATR